MTDQSAASPTIAARATQMVVQHPTTASAGLGSSLSIVIMSLLLHLNIHLTEEEAIAWSGLITATIGWALKVLSRRFPVLDIPPATPTQS